MITPVTTGRLPMRIKLAHGFGAVAFGVKDNGFSFFLLIFYNQALGMDAGTVGQVLLAALLVDALVDPLIGNLSDRTYTRWGRRLPWLYIAPIPLAVAWVFLWTPPGSSPPGALELFGIAVCVRLLLSACEVPSISLVPELTADYDERTTLFRYRFLLGWAGGLIMMVMAYGVFMPGPEGLLRAEGYLPFGIFGAVLMAVAVIGSALGQHRLLAHLPPQRPAPFSFGRAFTEIREAFAERAFLIFAAGALAAYVFQGMTFSISQYLNLFVWQFDRAALNVFPLALLLSAIIMFAIANPVQKRFGKPRGAMICALSGYVVAIGPYYLFQLGAWPDPGAPATVLGLFSASTALYFAFLVVGNALAITTVICASSMIADVVEAHQERTGRRSEGAFFSGNWLVQKCATGIGIFVTGQVIAASGLVRNARPGTVPASTLDTLIWLYVGIGAVLVALTAYWLGRFPIGRAEHEARVAALAEAARADREHLTITP